MDNNMVPGAGRLFSPPARVKPAVDIAAALAAAKAAHAEACKHGAAAVEAACRAGEQRALVQGPLKEQHRWVPELNKIGLPRRTATDYLTIYRDRSKWATVAHMGVAGVLNFLRTGKTGEEDEGEGEPAADRAGGSVAPSDEPTRPEHLDAPGRPGGPPARPGAMPSPSPAADEYLTDDDADMTPVAPEEDEAAAAGPGEPTPVADGPAARKPAAAKPPPTPGDYVKAGKQALGALARALYRLNLYERHRGALEAVIADLRRVRTGGGPAPPVTGTMPEGRGGRGGDDGGVSAEAGPDVF
jgi:hypothetical protein